MSPAGECCFIFALKLCHSVLCRAEDCCRSHNFISSLAKGYVALKALDPHHPTFGSINCESAWLFADNPSFLPPSHASAPTLRPGAQPASQLSLDVPLSSGKISTLGRRDGNFRNGIPFGPLGNILNFSEMAVASSRMNSALWSGTVTAETYYSAGWATPSLVASAAYLAAVSNYSTALGEFEPHVLARFGNTRVTLMLTNNATLQGRAWYDADHNTAFVAVVNTGGQRVSFTGQVLQAFNHRMVFATFNASIAAASTALRRIAGAAPPPPPPPPPPSSSDGVR